MEASILDLRKHMSKVLAAIDMNETVTLTYRGKEKAKIVPSAKCGDVDLMKTDAFGMWADRDDILDVESVVREIRKGRVNAL